MHRPYLDGEFIWSQARMRGTQIEGGYAEAFEVIRWVIKSEAVMARDSFPSVLMIMLCRRCSLGGAEKRYARVFEMLVDETDGRHRLLINRSMLDLLHDAGILIDCEQHLTVLDPPSRRWAPSQPKNSLWWSFFALLDTLWYTWQCWRVIQRRKPDVVHPLLTGVYFSLPALVLRPKIGRVMSAYSYEFVSERDKQLLGIPLGATLKRWAMQNSRAIDALSKSIRDDLIARGIDGDKIDTAPCSFTDMARCQPASERERWVVFLGRFIDNKAPLLLARAVPKVRSRCPDVHFHFLGEGYLQSRLEALVQELDVAEYVSIRFEPRPTRVLSRSSLFVSLQILENYPSQSLLEAMACGNAIVATDVGETWRLVDDETGIRVPPRVDAVADAIVELLTDPSLRQRGLASRQRVLEEHTPQRFYDYITHVYQRAAVRQRSSN
jgi:glycosyltransferase involved in cell wall biosynthesis